MPEKKKGYKIITCETCRKVIARFRYSAYPSHHVPKEKILSAIRHHYKKHHPRKFKAMAKKAVKTKRQRYGKKMRDHAKFKAKKKKQARKRKAKKPKGKGWKWNPKIKHWVRRKKKGRGFEVK